MVQLTPSHWFTGQVLGRAETSRGRGTRQQQQRTCHIELCEGVTSGRPNSSEKVGGLICKMAAVTEVKSRQEGHVANDEAKCGVCDIKACQPEVSHVSELAAIVLTCIGKKKNHDRNF